MPMRQQMGNMVRQYLYCMSQGNKNANKSFLQKFQGRTNKVDKTGLQSVLTPSKDLDKKDRDEGDQHLRKVDLDSLIPSNPEKNSTEHNKKRTYHLAKPPLKSTKQQYVPSTLSPMQNSEKQESASSHPPSRSESNSTANSRGKYIFGKYLKLDKQALGHIEFLQGIEEKSFFKRSIRSGSSHIH